MKLSKHDFYFGALLSLLVKTDIMPAMIEEDESNKVYQITTHQDYHFYAKYVSNAFGNNKDVLTWQFQFNEAEVKRIQALYPNDYYLFAFICGRKDLEDSEVAFLTIEDLQKCLGVDCQTQDRRIAVKVGMSSKYFNICGTGLNRQEQALVIKRDARGRLEDLKSGGHTEIVG
ncbi:hypothetical protein [Alkalicoccobacillus plakortidis]|uniref:Uncharacterized protein n=1 Tax=Alkalicoccobacillus plakortidis TaxID=444060 RepID=A0ABT0XJ20_9BACI|nr:hypothetical protein [Alkalicoccobacillus plakortidis]MCM2675908.1 hypothetical protein [Alkalicoccobacillus plakortidis]